MKKTTIPQELSIYTMCSTGIFQQRAKYFTVYKLTTFENYFYLVIIINIIEADFSEKIYV